MNPTRGPRLQELDRLIEQEDRGEPRSRAERLDRHAEKMRRQADETREILSRPRGPAGHPRPALVLPARVMEVLKRYGDRRNVSIELLRDGSYRPHDAVAARRDAIRELRAMGYSMLQIARFVNVHHTSVIHALKVIGPENTRVERLSDLVEIPDLSGEWAI